MRFIDRLRAATDTVYYNAPDYDWGDEWTPSLENSIPEKLLTMRRVKLRSALLVHIEDVSAAWTFEHAVIRAWRTMREIFTPLETPLVSAFKKSSGRTVKWGGKGMYFDVVTNPQPKPHTRSRFWRDPFVAACLILLAGCNNMPTAPRIVCQPIPVDTLFLNKMPDSVTLQLRPKCKLQ